MVLIMIAVVHTGGYAIIQVKHRRDINLEPSVYLSYVQTCFLLCNFWHIFRRFLIKESDKVA